MNYIISFPISGENNIINMLNILCNKNNIKYSFCDFYNCCKNINCNKNPLFSSNHDFNLDIKINPNNKYLVVYCNDVIIQLENYYNYDVLTNKKKYNNNDLINFFYNKINYYNKFVKKWVNTNYNNVLVINFFDFKFDINNISKNIFNFFFSSFTKNNELVNNELVNNELVNNELANNELVNNELVNNELVNNELVNNELVNNELVNNELVNNELVNNELVNNELVNNELVNNEYFNNLNNEITISNECYLFSKEYYNKLKQFLYRDKKLKLIISNLYNKYYYNYSNHIYFTEVLPYFTAIIIEPREHKALSLVLNNFIKNLDKNWTFYIYHGTNNKKFIKNIINKELKDYKKKIKLINLNVKDLSFEDYNKTLYNISFYDKINTEMFLIFQTDSLISNKYSKLIYNFIEYDYVGAPWLNGCIGNGGLSFRKTKKIVEILNNTSYYYIKDNVEELMNEDIFFSNNEEIFFKTDYIKETNNNIDKNNFINNNVYKPCLEEAKFFSVESIYNEISFGVHKPWLYLNNNELESIKKLFPELDLLYDLQ